MVFCLVHSGCLTKPRYETYYGLVVTPRTQELRWSDGGLPQTFDPAFAAAPPDTDAVRAIFEGLTEYDPRTLQALPAVASRWEPSEDGKVWTFYLRTDARWSNGEAVTAGDFVRSWQRTINIGQLSPHTELLSNIVGGSAESSTPAEQQPANSRSGTVRQQKPNEHRFGAEAISDHVLRVRLRHADQDFPALVAHPVFRPVKLKDESQTQRLGTTGLVSNGAFSLAGREGNRVLLERAAHYWDRDDVALQRVEFVAARDAESALAAYRAGEIDAVTNAPFEPLAVKLLSPYKDFHRTTYGALTYYSFNTHHAPFDDVRVREALAIAIDRERISRDDLDGATEPAGKFLPETMDDQDKPVVNKSEMLEHDINRARELLSEAGYPDGEGFPVIRLLINRNEQQRIVAEAIAGMWRNALGIETSIIMKSWDDYEVDVHSGAYDVVRRGIVMQTTDEFTNMRMMFRPETETSGEPAGTGQTRERGTGHPRLPPAPAVDQIESESQALSQLAAMPIYFASSYSLVKPYVRGFEFNVLDVPSLKSIRIETNMREEKRASLVDR